MPNPSGIGIKSFGAYVPPRRFSRKLIAEANRWAFPSPKSSPKGERSVCAWDEDVITMAVEAGRDCLRDADRDAVRGLTVASTSAPYADLSGAAIVAAALRLPRAARSREMSGSTRAGLSALIDSCAMAGAGDQLIVASEQRIAKPGSAQELQYGGAAAALLIGQGEDLVARFLGSETVSQPFFDHFRQSGSDFDYQWEDRWIRDEGVLKFVPETLAILSKRLGFEASEIAYFGHCGGSRGADALVARRLGIEPERVLPNLQDRVGDTGAAHPLLMLASALERAKPGDKIVIVSFAHGCEIVVFEKGDISGSGTRRGVEQSIANRIEETAYLKLLSFDRQVDLDWGMRAEVDNKTALTQLYRTADQSLGFVGGRCSACEAVQFPSLPTCVNCGAADTQRPYPLADEPAQIATFTADWLQYSPAPPLYMGLIQFDCGARILMEIVDVGPTGIDVGTPLKASFRIKERDRLRGFARYFWKASPAIAG